MELVRVLHFFSISVFSSVSRRSISGHTGWLSLNSYRLTMLSCFPGFLFLRFLWHQLWEGCVRTHQVSSASQEIHVLKMAHKSSQGWHLQGQSFYSDLARLGYISDWHGITLKEMGIAGFSHIFFIFYNRKPLRYTYFQYSLFTTTKILNSYFISQWSLISTQRTAYCDFIVSAVCRTFIASKGTFFLLRR